MRRGGRLEYAIPMTRVFLRNTNMSRDTTILLFTRLNIEIQKDHSFLLRESYVKKKNEEIL